MAEHEIKKEKCVLVLNMGMKSIRSIIFSDNGKKLAESSTPLSSTITDTRVEQDPNEWWEKGIQVMKSAIFESGRRSAIDYITVTSSASCLVCTDKDAKSIGNAIMVSDKRAESEAKEIASLQEFSTVNDETGLDMTCSLMIPKILWIKRNKPEIYEKCAYFLTPNDYWIFRLSGEAKTDYLNATKYHYSENDLSYPQGLLRKLDIDISKLPKVVGTGTHVGFMSDEICELVGLTTKPGVVISSYDAICSFLGSGVSSQGDASDVSGTVTAFRALWQGRHSNNNRNVYTMTFQQGDYSIIGGSNNLGGGLIEWVKQCYYLKEEYPYEVMEKEAGESDVGAKGIVFLPYLLGERAPLWDDKVRGLFFGLERMHTRKDMTRAVFESTGFIDKSILDAIEETGAKVNTVRLSGGLARVNLVSQIKADILDRDMLVLSEYETTSAGAAMMVFHGQGIIPTLEDAANRFVSVRMIIKPNSANVKKYNKMYELFQHTYITNKALFEDRQNVMKEICLNREGRIENL